MGEPWVILENRYGDGGPQNPTGVHLAEAITELYHEILPDAEHGSASLRYGYDDGPMYVIEVSRLRVVTFEEWADQDYETKLANPRIMRAVTEELALQLWVWLAHGEIDRVRAQPWDATDPFHDH